MLNYYIISEDEYAQYNTMIIAHKTHYTKKEYFQICREAYNEAVKIFKADPKDVRYIDVPYVFEVIEVLVKNYGFIEIDLLENFHVEWDIKK